MGEVRGEEEGRSSSLIWWPETEGEDGGRGVVERSVQEPERTMTPGLGSGSCTFHREHPGPEDLGHSVALQGPQQTPVARLHAAQSQRPKGPQVPTDNKIQTQSVRT